MVERTSAAETPLSPRRTPRRTLPGHWLVLAAATLWGTTGTSQALAPAGATPEAIGALRLLVGGGGLLLLALAGRAFVRSPAFAVQQGRFPLLAAVFASVCIAAYQVFFFAGVGRTGVAVGTVVGIGSAPLMAGALVWLLRGERPTRRWALATGLAVLGCVLLVGFGSAQAQSAANGIDPLGILLALGAGLAYALYTIASKSLLRALPPDAAMALVFCGGALLLLPLLLSADLSWLSDPRGLLVVAHLGLLATALSYALFGRGLRSVPASTAVTLTLAEPLTAGLLGVLVVGETLSLPAWGGIALIFAGLALLTRR